MVSLHRALKFEGATSLCRPLGRRMAACWRQRGGFAPELVLPVPPDPLRLGPRRRVPLRLARAVAESLGVPSQPRAARKTRHTRALSRLGAEKRRSALESAFCAAPAAVGGRRVLIVDDVATTLSTVTAVSEAVRRAGAREVGALVAARVPLDGRLGAAPRRSIR